MCPRQGKRPHEARRIPCCVLARERLQERRTDPSFLDGFPGFLRLPLKFISWHVCCDLRSVIREAINGLMSVVLAPACAACARPLENPLRSAVCDRCWNGIRVLQPPFCGVCGDPLRTWRSVDEGYRCEPCRVRRPHITAGRAIGDYEGSLRAIVHALKYDGRRSIARPLSALLRSHALPILTGADLAVPVPLHWSRQWRRGFNQAHELAVGLGLPVRGVLKRRRYTRSQTGLSADERNVNVRKAFVLSTRAGPLDGLCVVVVDDVSTTGATLEACARVLKEGGVREVRTLTAARVATAQSPLRQH
jgi:ComF family protein